MLSWLNHCLECQTSYLNPDLFMSAWWKEDSCGFSSDMKKSCSLVYFSSCDDTVPKKLIDLFFSNSWCYQDFEMPSFWHEIWILVSDLFVSIDSRPCILSNLKRNKIIWCWKCMTIFFFFLEETTKNETKYSIPLHFHWNSTCNCLKMHMLVTFWVEPAINWFMILYVYRFFIVCFYLVPINV